MKKLVFGLISCLLLLGGCSKSYDLVSKYKTHKQDNSNAFNEIELFSDKTCLMQDYDENGHVTQMNCQWKQLDNHKLKIKITSLYKSYVVSAVVRDNILLTIGQRRYYNINASFEEHVECFTKSFLDEMKN